MKKTILLVIVCCIVFAIDGCTTTGHFRVPEDTRLYVYKRPEAVTVKPDGSVTTRPFFWSAAGGIPYRLEKDGSVVQEGKLRSEFRPVSIFWPPFSFIYWPIGFRPRITYNLINGTQE